MEVFLGLQNFLMSCGLEQLLITGILQKQGLKNFAKFCCKHLWRSPLLIRLETYNLQLCEKSDTGKIYVLSRESMIFEHSCIKACSHQTRNVHCYLFQALKLILCSGKAEWFWY